MVETHINAADYGVDPAKYALWNGHVGHASTALADSTADFQAAFNAAAAAHADGIGLTITFPRGRYLLTGAVTVPDMPGPGGLDVDMSGVDIQHRQTVGTAMFRTALPTANSQTQTLNNSRQMWTWRGGFYEGQRLPGQVGFEWNLNARMVMDRVKVHHFDTGVHARFALHFKLRDSMIHNSETYGVRVEAEAGAWPDITPASAASNGTIIENVRFYGRAANTAQLRVVSSAHTVRDCTFEGVGGQYNYQFVNNNTSVLGSKLENCWFENDPAVAHVMIDTPHQFDLDFQYTNTSALFFDAHRCSLLRVRRLPWPSLTPTTSPRFKVDSVAAAGVNVRFDQSGRGGVLELANSNLWSNGVYPNTVSAVGNDLNGNPTWQANGTGNVAAKATTWKLGAPTSGQGAGSTPVGGTLPAVWQRTR